MIYKVFADMTLLIHFLWIGFLFLGAYAGVRSKALRILHLGGLGFALLVQVFGWYCPLTYLEVWLRSKHDPHLAYMGSFIIHYVEKMVYLEIPATLVLMGTIIVVGLNVAIYLNLSRKKGKRVKGHS